DFHVTGVQTCALPISILALLVATLAWVTAPEGDTPSEARAAGSGSVYLFAITDVRPRVLQKRVEEAMPGINVSVFGRVGDFSRADRKSVVSGKSARS